MAFLLLQLTLGQGEAIGKEHEAQDTGYEELHIGILELTGVLTQRYSSVW